MLSMSGLGDRSADDDRKRLVFQFQSTPPYRYSKKTANQNKVGRRRRRVAHEFYPDDHDANMTRDEVSMYMDKAGGHTGLIVSRTGPWLPLWQACPPLSGLSQSSTLTPY